MPPICLRASSTTRALSASDETSALMPCAPVSLARRLDVRVVAAGEDDLVSGLAGLLNERGANALAAAGDEKSAILHS